MRIRKSFEQAICILLLIGTSEGPLKSHELSKKLDVSDSYLKGGNIIDLLEEKYTIVKTVREYKKQINPNDMIITVENVYEEHIKEVLKLV